ncbi:MAG TPA: hypothetical protein VMJ14_02350 [Burkholderiales bacterium]|nr:hypothetical protein [Burkholderiales bacterium]
MRLATAALALAALAMPVSPNALATVPTNLPPEQHQGAISFIAGGNSDNFQAFERAAPDYPLALELLRHGAHRDAFLPGARISLRDAQGKEVLSMNLDGPFLLARVPAGRYLASVTYSGKTVKRSILVKHGDNHRVVLEWPDGV